MAKIEMDISEYDSMRENKKLLENSLEREQELNKQFLELQQEKIQILEDAKMKVVKISKKRKVEHLLINRVGDHIILKELSRIFGININHIEHNYIWESERLINILFKKTYSECEDTIETTIHGLDEIKVELRNEIKANIDSDIQTKLINADKIEDNFVTLNKSYLNLEKDYQRLLTNNTNLELKNKTLTELNTTQEIKIKEFEMYTNKAKSTEELLSQDINFFNRKIIIQNLKMLFNIK